MDVSLPFPEFERAVALTEGICRLKKPNSEWVSRFIKMEKSQFDWEIPASLRKIEKHGWKILRSGSFFGGGVWLKG